MLQAGEPVPGEGLVAETNIGKRPVQVRSPSRGHPLEPEVRERPYAEAFPSQELAHWISGHVNAFEAWGGCSRICVPDNPRTGVARAHRYEPILNATYAEMAAHYGVAVIPARPYKPRDTAKGEAGVQIVKLEAPSTATKIWALGDLAAVGGPL